jgi:uncharacterized protein (TIGR00369 family)
MNSQRAFPVYEPMHADFENLIRQNFAAQPMMKTIGATIETVEPGAVVIRLPFHDHLTQQNGYLHAGVVTTVLDTACGYAAFTLAPEGSNILSVEFKVNLLSPSRGDSFLATARVLKAGKTLTICEGELSAFEADRDSKLVAVMTATMIAQRSKD